MDSMIPTLLSIALYLAATAGFARRFLAAPARLPGRGVLLAVAGLGLLAHAAALWSEMDAVGGLDLGIFNAASLVTALMVAMVLAGALRRPLESLLLFVLPVAALMQLINQLPGTGVATLTRFPGGLEVHVITSVLAFSVFGVGVIQSLVLAWQDHRLRHRHPTGVVRALPPLREMEELLFRILGLGFILLTVALGSGVLYLEDLFAQHLAHKTLFSVAAWLVFGTLLFGRWRYGWRGRTAIRWTLGGFAALLVAYFGTKLVLELILGRT